MAGGDYWYEAFGDFKPHIDPHAAVKFVLNNILAEGRLQELSWLLTDGHEIGGLEGEPGWIVERRDCGPAGEHPDYADWPPGARFRAYVNPRSFELGYPEVFLDVKTFNNYVLEALRAYIAGNPSSAAALEILNSIESKNGEKQCG